MCLQPTCVDPPVACCVTHKRHCMHELCIVYVHPALLHVLFLPDTLCHLRYMARLYWPLMQSRSSVGCRLTWLRLHSRKIVYCYKGSCLGRNFRTVLLSAYMPHRQCQMVFIPNSSLLLALCCYIPSLPILQSQISITGVEANHATSAQLA